jgi:tetratricopeptide (TPR) repeat protein
MSNGVVPLFESGCQGLELVSSIKNFLTRFSFFSNSPESLAALLMIYLKNPESLINQKKEIYEHSKTFLMDQAYLESMNHDLKELINDRANLQEQHGASAILKTMETLFLESQFVDLMCLVEETLLRQTELSQKHLLSILGFKGDTLTHLGDLEKAEDTYRYGLSIDPEDLRCLRGLGHLNWQCHAHDQALTFFKKAVHKSPEDGLSCFGIGMVYSRLGLGEDAVYWLERSLQAHPPAPGALMAIAQTCAGLQQPHVAISLLSRTIENIGDHSILLLTLGQLYLADGKESLGNELIAKAMSRRAMIA